MIEESSEDSLKTLVDKYKYIVNAIVKKYLSRIEYSGLEEKDLIQEGLIGLVQAIKSFDKDKDVLFYTYATICVESRIKSVLRSEGRQKNKYLNSSLSLDMIFNDEFSLYDVLVDEEEDPGKKLMKKEEYSETIDGLKNKLTEFEKNVFDLKLSGLSNTEIALILDKEKRSIENTLSRIKQKYKEIKQESLV
jgi:RNA polymerase sporulation-specific sigma factor